MHRPVSLLFLLTLAIGCATATSTRPASIPQPEIDARLVQALFFGGGTTAPATIEVRIANRAKTPIVVRRIAIDSPGMQQYTLDRGSREVQETIQPGETKRVNVFSRATALQGTTITEPLNIRAVVDFESGSASWREVVMLRQ